MYFDLVTLVIDTLFAAIYPPPNGNGKLNFGDASGDPLSARLDAALGQQEAANLFRLHSREEKIVPRGKIWQIGWVGDHLGDFCHRELLDRNSG